MQQQRQLQEAASDGDEGINPILYAEMVKGLIPRYEFEGEAAELVGQVGMQPELGVKCRCCGEPERRKTLICDGCENSFHLKCLKLRSSHALLLDNWLCMECSSSLVKRPLQALREHTLAIDDDHCKTNSPSKRCRHSDVPITSQPVSQLEERGRKMRIVFKLKTSHFKGARVLASEEVQRVSDRSLDERRKEVLDSAERPSCQMECLSLVPQQELAAPSVLSSEEASQQLIHKKTVKLADALVVSEKYNKDVGNSKFPSCLVQSFSFDDPHNRAGLHQCENVNGKLLEGVENKVDYLASGKHTENSSELVTQHSCLECTDDDYKQNGSALSEIANEEKAMVGKANATEINEKIPGNIDITDLPTPNDKDCAMTSFVAPDLHSSTNQKVDKEAEKIRTLVRLMDDAQKQHWLKDAIELMDLESSRGSEENDINEGAGLLSKPHLQVHGKLDTALLLQVYADCCERCVIVYHLGREVEDHAEASQHTNVKLSTNTAIERTWSLGGGFYVLLLGSKEAAKEVIFNGTIPFQGGHGYAVPYVPCFSPNQDCERACPVWVTFLHLPIYFCPFLQELASWLGKVLYIPQGEALEASDSPRVCVCWKISKRIPEFLLVDMEGLGSKKVKIELDLSLIRHLSKSFLH